MQRLVLIDGNAIIHRAFHALPPLSRKDGQLTNAVYGFFSMFLKILEDLKPDCVIVCFDRPKPTFRQELYKEYQAHRPKMDEGLVPQFKIVHEILEKAKIKIFEMDGFEADDLIGTISKLALRGAGQNSCSGSCRQLPSHQCSSKSHPAFAGVERLRVDGSPSADTTPRNEDIEVIIVSGDRDLLQLVNSHVKMLAPVTGITNMILFDGEKVREKYGLEPKQIIDYKALVGDASDNYPGVQGIGPKTAINLLKDYQTLEGIYQNLDQIKKKNEGLAQKLKDGEESAELSKKLATIVLDVPVSLNLDECSGEFDKEEMKKSFEEYNFKSLIKRLEGENGQFQKQKEEKKGEQLGLL
ncbi:MAG: hypothetical protein M1450_02570 [Patescibacteria group bacterium]|nr:hypothetical protein [Patescibacteria group bacterium]